MKKIFALSTAAVLAASPAVAAPYLEVESNSGFSDGDYNSTLIETHVGYESPLGEDASWFIQGGPAFGFIPDEDSTQYVSGKVGVSVDLTEDLTGYGEVSAITADEFDFDEIEVGVKAGLKYTF